MSNKNINIFILKMNKKKEASLVSDEKKGPHLFFGEIKNKNLPASSVFQKSGLRNTCLFLSVMDIFSNVM